MANYCCSNKRSSWWSLVIIICFIINIRVEAGIATTFERMLDGLFAGTVLFVLIFFLARLLNFIQVADDSSCSGCKEENN